jgi:predicted Zn finger-like uncharacterized protein
MRIVCPHCTTSYAINPATLGIGGRTVRCSRCKEVWLARPEDAMEAATAVPAMAEASQSTARLDAAAEWQALGREEEGQDHPLIDSPSISADWPAEDDAASPEDRSVAHEEAEGQRETELTTHRQRLARLFRLPPLSGAGARGQPSATLPTACAAMGALVLALVIWRADVVRLLPQTALFYKMVGLDVNLRGLAFKDIKVTHETADGKPVLVIEGVIVGETRKPVDLPRLRFSVRDAQDLEIYAWNAVLEQPMLKPGERAFFKSRLASPPPDGRNIDVRFFNKRDLAGGHA